MSPEEQAEIFRICVQAVEQGKATIDQCVARYPAMADLRQMLEISTLVKQVPPVTFPEASKRSLEQRLVTGMSSRSVSRLYAARGRTLGWLRLPLVLLTTLCIALGTGFVIVQASQATLPGDTLYGIKRTVEHVELSFASAQSRPAVLSTIALTRLNELSTLMDRGEPVAPSFWNDVTSSLYIAASAQTDPALRANLFLAAKQTLDHLSQTGNRPDLAGSLNTVLESLVTPTPTATPTELQSTSTPLSPTAMPAKPMSTSTSTMTASPLPSSTLTWTPQSSPTPNYAQLRAALSSCVTDKAMIQSLTVKINAGQLGAFINEVRAQSGKKIPTACANNLIQIAQSLSH